MAQQLTATAGTFIKVISISYNVLNSYARIRCRALATLLASACCLTGQPFVLFVLRTLFVHEFSDEATEHAQLVTIQCIAEIKENSCTEV